MQSTSFTAMENYMSYLWHSVVLLAPETASDLNCFTAAENKVGQYGGRVILI